jgi:uncharacterized cupin superfamily protein
MAKKIEVSSLGEIRGSRYPVPHDRPCVGRIRQTLGDAAGLTQFGVNLTRLPSGCWSSQRHWHTVEDEFVFVLEGSVVLVTNSGEETLVAGDSAGFKAGVADGHHLQNRSSRDALLLEVGTRRPDDDEVLYSDIDLRALKGRSGYVHKSGEAYVGTKPRNPATGS